MSKKYRLNTIFDLQMGKTPARARAEYWNDGSNDWVSIADMSTYAKYVGGTKETITDIGVKESGIRPVPPNTVILSFKLSLGKVAITTDSIYTNEAIMAFLDKGVVDVHSDYVYYLFSSMDWAKGTNKAVKGTTLNKATLGAFEITLPPVAEQRKIAAVLDKATALIADRKRQLEQLDLLVKSRFVEMFGEPETNPMGWEVKELQEVGDVGSSRRVFASEFTESGVPFFRGTEISLLSKGGFTAPKYYIAEEHYEKLKALTGVPKVGDLLLPSICAEGEVWMVDIETPFYIKDGRVLWVQIGDEVNGLYLRYALKNKLTEDYQQVASGTTFAEMKIFALKKVKLLIPPLPLQEKFADFVRQVDKSKFEIQQGLETLELQYNALMQRYFG